MVITWTARRTRDHALAAVLLLLPALAACGSPEEARVQRVAYCQGPSADNDQGDPIQVEFRQGSTVVHRATVSVGTAFTAEVPWGATDVYVGGVRMGAVNEGVPEEAYGSPDPGDAIYLRSPEGCPENAPAEPSSP